MLGLGSRGVQHFFKACGREPTQGGMWTDGIVESFQIGKHIILSSGSRRILLEVDQLAFETTEEIFGHSVVIWIAPAGHALAERV